MDRSLKQQLRDLLQERDDKSLFELCEKDSRFWKELRFLLYTLDERLRWSAIEAVGKYMQHLWQQGRKEKVREYIRNLFWSITDESGGIGWSAPQTIAEIIVNIPELIDPYGSMVIAHTLEELPLVKGGLWAVGRMGRLAAGAVSFFQEMILEIFRNGDAETLGLAAWAMGEVGFEPALPFLEKLAGFKEPVRIYIKTRFHEKPLGQWAREAIIKINKRL